MNTLKDCLDFRISVLPIPPSFDNVNVVLIDEETSQFRDCIDECSCK